MKIVLVIFGTRPEAIKLAPVIKELKKLRTIKTVVGSTGQHKEMLRQVLDIFNLKVDYDLDLMKSNQDLFDVTINSLSRLKLRLNEIKPDILIVQGDTTSAFASALAAFYLKIKIGHVEAGLRSFNKISPYPEEVNRKFISAISDFHFAPTKMSKQNLLEEGIGNHHVYVTGNTVIDSLLDVSKLISDKKLSVKIEKQLIQLCNSNIFNKKIILITLHRREKFGAEFKKLLNTIKDLAKENPNYNFVYPVHLNPNVKNPVTEVLNRIPNIVLVNPLDYLSFIYLMKKSYFIISDSGGVQEECYIFKKPILVMRDVTERMEAIKAGYAFLVGSSDKIIKRKFNQVDKKLKNNFNFFKTKNPFGDGKAAKRIVKIIQDNL